MYNLAKLTLDRFDKKSIMVQLGGYTKRFPIGTPRDCCRCRASMPVYGKSPGCRLGFDTANAGEFRVPITACVPMKDCNVKGAKWIPVLKKELEKLYGLKS